MDIVCEKSCSSSSSSTKAKQTFSYISSTSISVEDTRRFWTANCSSPSQSISSHSMYDISNSNDIDISFGITTDDNMTDTTTTSAIPGALIFHPSSTHEPPPAQQRKRQRKTTEERACNATTTLLLLSIIESLCKAHAADNKGNNDEAANQHFLLICQTLKQLGVLNDDDSSLSSSNHSSRQHSPISPSATEGHPFEGDKYAKFRSASLEAFEQLFFNAKKRQTFSNISSARQQQQQQPSSFSKGVERKLLPFSPSLDTYSMEAAEAHDSHSHIYSLFSLTFEGVRPARYHRDFVELDLLGRGGFASVWKAEHKLENIHYAIKKIPLRTYLKDGYEKIFREVKHLARLQHTNVVRYYTSWTEFVSDAYLKRGTQDDGDDDDDDDDEDDYGSDGMEKSTQKQHAGGTFVLFIQMELCNTTLQDFLKLRNQKPNEYFDEKQNVDIFRQILEGIDYIHQQGIMHRDLKPGNIFLMPPTTTTTNGTTSVKPTVIPKIGDFGLSVDMYASSAVSSSTTTTTVTDCCATLSTPAMSGSSTESVVLKDVTGLFGSLTGKSEGSTSDGDSSTDNAVDPPQGMILSDLSRIKSGARTSGVGTRTYASPEQLATRCRVTYNEKVDIYSLGIILFELFQPFSSAMERARSIDQLKQKGILPSAFQRKYPYIGDMILHMLHPDPQQRPSAVELLQNDIFSSLDSISSDSSSHRQHRSLTLSHSLVSREQNERLGGLRPSLPALPSPRSIEANEMDGYRSSHGSHYSTSAASSASQMERLEMKYKEAMMENEQLQTKLRLMEKQLSQINMKSTLPTSSQDTITTTFLEKVPSVTNSNAGDSYAYDKRAVSKIFSNFILSSHH
ncbi:kinase-like domain-containing protein [Mycotypha africana]|uniref:kinase-like domain-containing protein n=1 Tax=Mycotypha africana TaxID=64632 RepID=UPI0022FFD924|nr:kinase-like domain-containing protein [Mycotypha africana]KAI8982093.1 kinase-like domain-containing protein [Mycotypha africana]